MATNISTMLWDLLHGSDSDINWLEVIQICKSHRHHVKSKDWKKRTPLHIACLKNPPIRAIKAIIKADKSALASPDANGLLPIQYICAHSLSNDNNDNVSNNNSRSSFERYSSTLDILKILVEAHPESVFYQDRKGCTALHHCCISHKGFDFFKCLLGVNAERDDESNIACIKEETRKTALHLAVIENLDSIILEELIRAAPKTAQMEDVRGYYPLHYACAYLNIGLKTVRTILQQYTRASRIRCNNNSSCLDILTRTYREHLDGAGIDNRMRAKGMHISQNEGLHELKCTPFILNYWEKAVLITGGMTMIRLPAATDREAVLNVHGVDCPSLLIHNLIGIDRCPCSLISLAIALHPEWVTHKDHSGNLPLHTAAAKPISRRCIANHVQIVKSLILFYPKACKSTNNQGKYPLNLAIESGKNWKSGVRNILNAFPEAIDSLDLDARLYPFLFARASTGTGADVSNLFKLITMFPNVVPSSK